MTCTRLMGEYKYHPSNKDNSNREQVGNIPYNDKGNKLYNQTKLYSIDG